MATTTMVSIDPPEEPIGQGGVEEQNVSRGGQRVVRVGMERGFPYSPMFKLYSEYTTDNEYDHSVSRKTMLLATSPNLRLSDVEEEIDKDGSKIYRLKEETYRRTTQTMTELQSYIKRMAGLIK